MGGADSKGHPAKRGREALPGQACKTAEGKPAKGAGKPKAKPAEAGKSGKAAKARVRKKARGTRPVPVPQRALPRSSQQAVAPVGRKPRAQGALRGRPKNAIFIFLIRNLTRMSQGKATKPRAQVADDMATTCPQPPWRQQAPPRPKLPQKLGAPGA